MRVLVTNAASQQTYTIIAGLRPYADRLVVVANGRTRLGAALSPSYRSRLVDARYIVPSPPKPWIAPEPTVEEERYVEALVAICAREALSLVIPSADDVAFILSRHKARFARHGVTVAVPEFEIQSRIMDKASMLRAAERAGIPVPRTFVPQTRREADDAVEQTGLPAVVKPTFDAGGEGLRWILRRDDLRRFWRPPTRGKADLLIQEFIPGPISPLTYGAFTVMDQSGQLKAMFTHQRLRYARWHICMPHAASVSTTDEIMRQQTVDLLRTLRHWGAACVEWKRDPRDGRIKLLEPNARMGAPAWPALAAGVNIPWILAQVALGNDPPPVIDIRDGRFYVDPVCELLAFATYVLHGISHSLRHPPSPGIDSVPSARSWLADLKRTYRSGNVVTSDFWRALVKDPVPGILFWASQVLYVATHHQDFLPRR